jgi:hypothetical protein
LPCQVDNSILNGDYQYFLFEGEEVNQGSGLQQSRTEYGDVTFDGAGSFTGQELGKSDSDTFDSFGPSNYFSCPDGNVYFNDFTGDFAGIVANAASNAGVMVASGSDIIIIFVKKSSGFDSTDIDGVYRLHTIYDDGSAGPGYRVTEYADITSEGDGLLDYSEIANSKGETLESGTDIPVSVNGNGTFTVDSSLPGILSPDKNIFALISAELGNNPEFMIGIIKSSGKSNDVLSGIYQLSDVFDTAVTSGGSMEFFRMDESAANLASEVTINSDGTFVTSGSENGIISPDNQVFVYADTDENGDDVGLGIGVKYTSVTHNGITYNYVISPYSERVWLDRNLGASRVCTSFDDAECFGDYYQWGRAADGHQLTTAGTTTTAANTIDNVGPDFIVGVSSDWTVSGVDTNGVLRSAVWSRTDGTSVCPTGFRVPTNAELQGEIPPQSNNTGFFESDLKLPSAGARYYTTQYPGIVRFIGDGRYWTSTPGFQSFWGSGTLAFADTYALMYTAFSRAYGFPVRCIQD